MVSANLLLILLCIAPSVVKSTNTTIKSNYCEVLPEREGILSIKITSVTHIELGAFDGCPNLEEISISGNIGLIEGPIFRENKNLSSISFRNAGLFEIRATMFTNLNNLTSLDLSNNFLNDFPLQQMPVLPSLRTIYLRDNSINDLEVKEVHIKFPSLKELFFYKNFIECDIFEEINKTLTSLDITLNDSSDENESKCVTAAEVNKIYSDAKLSTIKGRLDNQAVKGEVKELKETNEVLKENFTRVEEEVESVLVHISEIYGNLTYFSNQIISVHSVQQEYVTKNRHKTEDKPSNVVYFIAGFTFFLALTVGFVVKCFVNMRRDLQKLRKREGMIGCVVSTTSKVANYSEDGGDSSMTQDTSDQV